jgi:hypothetical protein
MSALSLMAGMILVKRMWPACRRSVKPHTFDLTFRDLTTLSTVYPTILSFPCLVFPLDVGDRLL